MIPTIDYDLNRIVQYTYNLAGYSNCKAIFGGVTSITDFAKFVYFEYCAIRYINSEEHHSVHYYLAKQNKQYYEAYRAEERNKNEDSDDVIIPYSYTWLYSKDYDSFSRSVLRYIEYMTEKRQIPQNESDKGFEASKALRELIDYEGHTYQERLAGTPIGTTYFYQALCECVFKINGTQKYKWLAQGRTSTETIEEFYSDVDRFIKNFMLVTYSSGFTDTERRDYIAKAINLVKFADRRKLDLIFDFAICMEENCPDYFSYTEVNKKSDQGKSRYRFSDLPPIFYDSVPAISWELDVFDTQSIEMFSELYEIFKGSDGTVSLASPYMRFDSYVKCFLCASEDYAQIEEVRYYMIKLLGESVKNALLAGKVNVEYSEKNFSAFINNHYNVFEEYKGKHKKRASYSLTKRQANLMRKISSYLYSAASTE